MRLGREVNDVVAALHRGIYGLRVADVFFDRLDRDSREVRRVTRVSLLVEIDDRPFRPGFDELPNEVRADEAQPAGD